MENNEVKAHVLLGKDAEDFFESDLGRAVLGMAQQDQASAIQEMALVNLADGPKAVEAQVELRTTLRFERYLAELITRAREEFESYKQQKEGQ